MAALAQGIIEMIYEVKNGKFADGSQAWTPSPYSGNNYDEMLEDGWFFDEGGIAVGPFPTQHEARKAEGNCQ